MKTYVTTLLLVMIATLSACGWGKGNEPEYTLETRLAEIEEDRATTEDIIALQKDFILSTKEDLEVEKVRNEIHRAELATAVAAKDDLYAREMRIEMEDSDLHLKMLHNGLNISKEAMELEEARLTYFDQEILFTRAIEDQNQDKIDKSLEKLEDIETTQDKLEDGLLELDLANIRFHEEEYSMCKTHIKEYAEMIAIADEAGDTFLVDRYKQETKKMKFVALSDQGFLQIQRNDLKLRNDANKTLELIRELRNKLSKPLTANVYNTLNRRFDRHFKTHGQILHKIEIGSYRYDLMLLEYNNWFLASLDVNISVCKKEQDKLEAEPTKINRESTRRIRLRIEDHAKTKVTFNKHTKEVEDRVKRLADELTDSEISKLESDISGIFDSISEK